MANQVKSKVSKTKSATASKDSKAEGAKPGAQLNRRKIFKFLTVFSLMVGIPVGTSLITSKMDTLVAAMLIPAFLFYTIFNMQTYKQARRTPYLPLALHTVCFLIVNLSFWIVALFVYLQDGKLDVSFKYAIPAMGIFWGLNLMIHTVASIAGSGFEE